LWLVVYSSLMILLSTSSLIHHLRMVNIITDESLNEPHRDGSIIGHETVNRESLLCHYLLYRDYFSDNPTFGSEYFS
jgi:hypothetical protein